MMKLATASMFVLFWVFYEVSGGADFTPRERVVVSQAPWVLREQAEQAALQAPMAETAPVVAVTATPLSPATPTPAAAPVQVALQTEEVPVAEEEAVITAATAAPAETSDEVIEVAFTPTTRAKALRLSPPVTAPAEILLVSGSRVNMRAGPGTNHAVLETLLLGTRVEKVSAADNGWMEIQLVEGGSIGWMSADFLQAE